MKNFKIKSFSGITPVLFLGLVVIVAAAVYLEVLPDTMVGALAFLFVFGALFGEIGNRIPFWNKYIGGGAILVFLLASVFSTYEWIPAQTAEIVNNFYDSWDFLALFISVLITGSLLGVNRKLLMKSLKGYIPAILGAVIVSAVFGVVIGLVFGVGPVESILSYVMPIMGGGTGAGAIPMSQMYAEATGNSADVWFAFAISILTIANVFSIIMGSLLDALGKKRPELTGNGALVKAGTVDMKADVEEAKVSVTMKDYAAALMFATSMYVFATVYSEKLSIINNHIDLGFKIHKYAFLVVFIALINIFDLVPPQLKEGAKSLSKFFSSNFLWVLMAAVGMSTDMNEILKALTIQNVMIALVVVIGAALGGAIVGNFFGFYPIESAITAGLCMANRGGSGDIAVLGAANRMELMSYAQISSRIGGSMILIIASVLFGLFL